MKKILVMIGFTAVMAMAYCKYMSKSGEYDSNKTYSYGSVWSRKVCVYGNGKMHIPVAHFGQYYCPYSIKYDEYRNRLCDWN